MLLKGRERSLWHVWVSFLTTHVVYQSLVVMLTTVVSFNNRVEMKKFIAKSFGSFKQMSNDGRYLYLVELAYYQ